MLREEIQILHFYKEKFVISSTESAGFARGPTIEQGWETMF